MSYNHHPHSQLIWDTERRKSNGPNGPGEGAHMPAITALKRLQLQQDHNLQAKVGYTIGPWLQRGGYN